MESYIVRLSSKGQLTLPRNIRKKLQLEKGTKLFVVLDNNEIKMKTLDNNDLPVFSEKSNFLSLIGSFEGTENLAEDHDKYLAEEK